MASEPIRIVWSDYAKSDLKGIYIRIKRKTKSIQNAKNVISDILQKSKDIQFLEQYQVDEFLGLPYRRMIVRHFKIVFKVDEQKKELRILQIFDNYQSTTRLRR